MRLARDQVQRTGCRGTKDSVEGIIAHRKMLSVVPESSDRIAVVIVHHDALVGATAARYGLYKLVHQPVIERFLLISVPVILVTRQCLNPLEPLPLPPVPIVG